MIDMHDQPTPTRPLGEVSLPEALLLTAKLAAIAVADVFTHPVDYYRKADHAHAQAIEDRGIAQANRLLERNNVEAYF